MPLWPSPSKATMSPGWSWLRATGIPIPYWAATPWGSETPTCANTYITKPEQSNPLGDAPPHTYGVPRYCIAIATTPPRLGAETGAGADDDAELPELLEPPPPLLLETLEANGLASC